MLTRSFCAATAEHAARDAMLVGSAGASPSHGTSYGREGEAPADPNPSFNLAFTVDATNLAKANVLLNIQPHFFSAGDHIGDMFTT